MKRLKVWLVGSVTASGLLLGAFFNVLNLSGHASAQSDSGWVTLLDSTNMGQWDRLGEANWTLADGAVVADKKEGKDFGYLVTKTAYKDFQIRAEFWADDEANSGIFIRCSDPKKVNAEICYEVNIYDKRPEPEYGTGAIVNVAKVVPMPKAGGKWNTYEITAKGPHLVVVLNGVKTVDVEDTKHAEGPFALQYASGIIKFRKVQIKSL